jgi:phytoene dehydrogenase-like protein
MPDAVIVGTGPNGLAAGVVLARAGLEVELVEGADTIGGGARTKELMLDGHFHDVCSAVHPMALGSPFFQAFELAKRVEFVVPEIAYAHPLDTSRPGIAYSDIDKTAEYLGTDGRAWKQLLGPLVRNIGALANVSGGALLRIPNHPVMALQLGLRTLEQGSIVWNRRFKTETAKALLTGVNAHSIGKLPSLATAGAGLTLAAHAHAQGWPIPRGGSQAIADAMATDIVAHGGVIRTSSPIETMSDLPNATAYLFDTSAKAMVDIASQTLPHKYKRTVESFQYGNGVTKLDFILSDPVPWSHPEFAKTGTLHLGGNRAELAHSESQVARGVHPESPYMLVSQPSGFDNSRCPPGRHILWTYAHVPKNSDFDMKERCVSQIERFAPGFRDTIIEVKQTKASELSEYNPNYIGGDISAGAVTMWQILKRPVLSPDPWKTPAKGIYLCSSSTTPGPGVHGLCGMHAAASALKHEFGINSLPALGMQERA